MISAGVRQPEGWGEGRGHWFSNPARENPAAVATCLLSSFPHLWPQQRYPPRPHPSIQDRPRDQPRRSYTATAAGSAPHATEH
jgi:hypothetical protein